MKIAILPGDGIGPEIIDPAVKVLNYFMQAGMALELDYAPIGGAGYRVAGDPLPEATLSLARTAWMLKTANRIEKAVARVIARGLRTADIYSTGHQRVGCAEMGDAVVAALSSV